MAYIYKITNIINQKIYIGQTIKNIHSRFAEHCREAQAALDGRRNSFPYFHRALIKYGAENFLIEELEECPRDELDEREIYWIQYYDSFNIGYNSTFGGQTNTPVAKKVLQYSLSGYYIKTLNSAVEASKEEQVAASSIRKACIGTSRYSGKHQYRWYTEDFPTQIEPIIDERNSYTHSIIQYSLAGDFIKQYSSIAEAAKEINVHYQTMTKAVQGKIKTSKGFQWRYAEDTPPNSLIAGKEKEVKTYRTSRPVSQYSKNLELIMTYNSLKEAAEELETRTSLIADVCDGKRKTTSKFIWKWADIEE